MKEKTEILGRGQQDPNDLSSRAIGDVTAMQLSSIAYCSLSNNVKTTLNHYLPKWELVWQPTQAIQGNWAFIAYNGVQYVLVIRGSILNFSWGAFDNWFKQDFNLFEQVPWTYTDDTSNNPMISIGASEGLKNLAQLVDSNGETILGFLQKNAFPKNKYLCVTGHSLGANLATVVGPWLRYNLLKDGYSMPAIFSILTFAAPTSWNAGFAAQFDANFTNTWRYYNEIDIVPYSATNIAGLSNLFSSPAPSAHNISVTVDGVTVSLAEAFAGIAATLFASQIYYNSFYTQVNQLRGSIPLNIGRYVYPVNSKDLLIEQWFLEAGNQHAHNHYLHWLGATPLSCC